MRTHMVVAACLIVLALGSVAAVAAETQPLFEASFEEGAAGATPEGWVRMFEAPNVAELSTREAHSGKQSLHVLDTSDKLACSLRSPRIPVQPGTSLLVTAWYKGAADSGASLYVEFWNEAGKRLEKEDLTILRPAGTGQWEQVRGIVEVPAAAVALTLLPSCWSGGQCDSYYDDLRAVVGAFEPVDRQALPPATVAHPCGLYKAEDIARARENIKRHQWARDQLQALRNQAKFWMELPADQIPFWIPAETPMRVMDCPRCGANWDYAWKSLSPDRVQCTRCGLTLPDPAYPEDKHDTYVNPVGRKVRISYYQDARGEKYRISALLRYRRIIRLNDVGALGKVYALTGEREYAEKAVPILRRVAEVYPGYLAHDWDRVYLDYSNLQSGKLSGWKLHDEGTFLQLGLCYDLIYNSGVLTEADKQLIENGAFRECALLLTATSPKGCCINDGPYAMSCGAMLGALLGDHNTVKWAVDHPDGFRAFIKRYFFRDGHWEDGSFSYEGMALGPLYACPEILQGYSDPPAYTGADRYDKLDLLGDPLLRKIYVAPLTVLTPQRTGPPISDSCLGAQYPRRHAETNFRWYPTERNRRLLAGVFDGKFGDSGDEYALFRRDPAADLSQVAPLDLSARSLVRPGVGWAILRTGPGPDAAAVYLKYGVYGSGHGHPDKLNFLFYDQGAELISDQGYLGARHEISPWNRSTLCHNVVMFDGQPQTRAAGELLAFMAGDTLQTVLARGEKAAPPATRYERLLSLVDHGVGRRYLLDVVRAEGGARQDFVMHGAGQDFTPPSGNWQPFTEEVCTPAAGGGGKTRWLRSVQGTTAPSDRVTATWSEGGRSVRLDQLTTAGTQLLHLVAPGQRNRNNPWEKRDLHLLQVRRPGPSNVFVSVLQAVGASGPTPAVQSVPITATAGEARAVEISGPDFTDLLAVTDPAAGPGPARCGDRLAFTGQQAFVSRAGNTTTVALMNGTKLRAAGVRLTMKPPLHGKLVAVDQEHFSVTVDCADLPGGAALAGQQLLVAGRADGAFEIESVARQGSQAAVRLADEPTLALKAGEEFTITTFVEITMDATGLLRWRGNVPCEVELTRAALAPAGPLVCRNSGTPTQAYMRPAGGRWTPLALTAAADGWRLRLDPSQATPAVVMLSHGPVATGDAAPPRLLRLRVGDREIAGTGDVGYLPWAGSAQVELAEAGPLTEQMLSAEMACGVGQSRPVRITREQAGGGRWRLGLHTTRDQPPGDYTLTLRLTDALDNAATYTWRFSTRGFVLPFRTAPVLDSSGRTCAYFGGQLDTRFYRAEQPGDFVTYGFTAPQTALYEVSLDHTTSDCYGQFQVLVDGAPLGTPVDGYSAATVAVGGSPVLGQVRLSAGPHRLTCRVTGKQAASTNHFFALVALILRPLASPTPTRTP